jgi:hypothetical protein
VIQIQVDMIMLLISNVTASGKMKHVPFFFGMVFLFPGVHNTSLNATKYNFDYKEFISIPNKLRDHWQNMSVFNFILIKVKLII